MPLSHETDRTALFGPAADRAAALDRIERFYDAVPRSAARAEDLGPLTLFVREDEGMPYYARPGLGRCTAADGVTAADVRRVRERQRALGLPESFEWVAETAPALRAAAEEAGLAVHAYPLMVLAADPDGPDAPGGPDVRPVGPDDPAFTSALAVPYLAFADPGTGVGTAGPAELASAAAGMAADGSVARAAARARAGLTVTAAALAADGTAECSGQYQPVGAVAELVGIGTLPTARRRGLARAVTAVLAADARARGAETVFLTAGGDDQARLYGRVGFRRIGTALIAGPAEEGGAA
ncbi:GNAT family N-acetyltransferase [Kitasatospora sp. NBC_01539]|uniref:GNAT family N-acetyltransferase n=1 Tax=Kitasatospora sp. NBC_01539 TaxID=2903577 RepID=UPI003860136F